MRNLLIILGFVGGLACHSARAAEMVNVEYIHLLIAQKWGIAIPYNPNVTNSKVAANMEYLLGVVDITNKRLNGDATTDYLHSKYATKQAADTDVSIDATDRLIKIEPKFWVTTTADTSEFKFKMSAQGTFQIYWGDGTWDVIKRTDTDMVEYSHTYTTAGEYKIGFGGWTTKYNSVYKTTTITFQYQEYNEKQDAWVAVNNTRLAKIEGSLGAVFPTIGDGATNGGQPRFYQTFSGCTNLTGSIPEDLFAGVSGAPVDFMFADTFRGCSGLSGAIPAKLFAGISGAPSTQMFSNTFSGCTNLTGEIPHDLFAGISGKPTLYLFSGTFFGCAGLSGSIPHDLFAGISGAPAMRMFQNTFQGCAGLSGSIPAKLFAGISGAPAEHMFQATFASCAGLTEIPADLFVGIRGAPAKGMFGGGWHGTFHHCTGLTKIPAGLFAGIQGAPAEDMFRATFWGCSGLTEIPADLFAGISGDAAPGMFVYTFGECHGLAGQSARIDGVPLYQIWPDATPDQVGACYIYDDGLSDYSEIPDLWKQGLGFTLHQNPYRAGRLHVA